MAEYAKVDIDQVVPKPKNLSLAEAATVPLSALTAWQALFVHANLQKGDRLLVTAAAGGTGIFAVQFAKHIGAHVIGTASSARSKELLEKLGVDEIVDYKATELEDAVTDVDLVLECVGDKVLGQCFRVVKKGGRVVSICTFDAEEKAKQYGVSCKFFIVTMDADQLRTITELLEGGQVVPVLDKTFPLERARDAFVEASSGHVHGKVVITVS
jgi:NADPH:quinone reductase-like Zn-dependent oxidoreductase